MVQCSFRPPTQIISASKPLREGIIETACRAEEPALTRCSSMITSSSMGRLRLSPRGAILTIH